MKQSLQTTKKILRAIAPPIIYQLASRMRRTSKGRSDTSWKSAADVWNKYVLTNPDGVIEENRAVVECGFTVLGDSELARSYMLLSPTSSRALRTDMIAYRSWILVEVLERIH